ncbi:MAG: histidine phosphatase family protein [Flammeovirgaceae bacterium]|nr:histidine phosphatase family protein [Flammeovirgaceae bacterium]
MRTLFLLLFLFLLNTYGSAQQRITTFILVRHAEKQADGSKDAELSEIGKVRAERLNALLKETAIDAVYSTPYKRTRNTVAAIAEARNLQLQDYEAMKSEPIEEMLSKHRGGTVLISGHSNTIPWTANLLIGEAKYAAWDDSEYGNVIIISVTEIGKDAKVLWLKY